MSKLENFLKDKYPVRAKDGIRSVTEKESFIQIMFNGGETLYLSKDKLYG